MKFLKLTLRPYNYFLLVIIIVGLFVILGAIGSTQKEAVITLHTARNSVGLEVVKDQKDLEHGLADRDTLPANKAMFFVFPHADYWPFWAKDMKFSIDIIWLDANLKVLTIKKNVSPDTFPSVFFPVDPARYVLEASAGFADGNAIVEGMVLDIR